MIVSLGGEGPGKELPSPPNKLGLCRHLQSVDHPPPLLLLPAKQADPDPLLFLLGFPVTGQLS